MGNLATPLSVQKLQTTLHVKAKGEPSFRFYALYDKVHREDVLRHAYARCKANGGSAGVDEERFEDIEAYGPDRWLGELAKQLKEKSYQPQAVRRVYIPKSGDRGCVPCLFRRSVTERFRRQRGWCLSPSLKPICRTSNTDIGRSAMRSLRCRYRH